MNITIGQPPATDRPLTNRSGWHRRTGLLPIGYLAAIVAVGLAHPFVPQAPWLLLHLLMLGAATNAILVWGAHFAAAVLHAPARAGPRGEAIRLVTLNAGVLAVLTGGAAGAARPGLEWVGVAGAGAVFAAVAAHLWVLAGWLRHALPARFTLVVHYYLAAAVALMVGIPAGAWMLVIDDDQRPRLLLFHAHVNLLGWVTLTVLGTLLTLWPTVLRTRVVPGAVQSARRALPVCLAGLTLLAVGTLAWWPAVAVAGLACFAAAVALLAVPAVATARQRATGSATSGSVAGGWSFAPLSIAASVGWLLVALVRDAVLLLRAPDASAAADGFDAILVPLGVGFVAQVLLGALSYLLPMALGGGPERVRANLARFNAHASQRVVMANLALAVYALPTPPYVRIAAAVLVLGALLQFLAPAVRTLFPAVRPLRFRPPRGAVVGLVVVLLAVAAGALAQRLSDPGTGPAVAVTPTGHTTTVAVTADGMRYHPDHIEVPAGDRLVIQLTNTDERRHDLVLSTGAHSALLSKGGTARVDAGIIGGTVKGWCTQPAHRASGMTLTITGTGGGTMPGMGDPQPASSGTSTVDPMADPGPGFVARDARLAPAPAGHVHSVVLHATQVRREVAAGVTQTQWTFGGTVPGPALRGRVGDVFEVTLVNDTDVEHGIDFHAEALAPDTAMRTVEPGHSTVYRFTATRAGVWMYHCSAMPMLYHLGNGMYGALIVDPPDLAPVDREYLLVQSELYLGAAGQLGDLAKMEANRPDAVMFNGYVSQYAFRPLTARTGERVRIWVLDAGPNRSADFHVVGAPFDTVYAEGAYRLRPTDPGGAQVLDLAPASGGFVEAVFGQAGSYPFLTHAMADADAGAHGTIRVSG
jgi:nitrite reductase (NO-forming)